MRGKGTFPGCHFPCMRITPAYAGKRYTPWHLWNRYKDHPRLCGEKAGTADDKFKLQGSPPPMRGKDIYHDFLWWQDGITPAYAGKSPFYRIDSYLLEDHPRLCGEKLFTQCQLRSSLGSPPPMRGKVHEMLFCKLLNRITPAYAGKSFSFSLSITCLLGSPPPMRGKVLVVHQPYAPFGITPAYAGKSQRLLHSQPHC